MIQTSKKDDQREKEKVGEGEFNKLKEEKKTDFKRKEIDKEFNTEDHQYYEYRD